MSNESASQIDLDLDILREKKKHLSFPVVIVLMVIEICKNLFQNFGLLMYVMEIHIGFWIRQTGFLFRSLSLLAL